MRWTSVSSLFWSRGGGRVVRSFVFFYCHGRFLTCTPACLLPASLPAFHSRSPSAWEEILCLPSGFSGFSSWAVHAFGTPCAPSYANRKWLGMDGRSCLLRTPFCTCLRLRGYWRASRGPSRLLSSLQLWNLLLRWARAPLLLGLFRHYAPLVDCLTGGAIPSTSAVYIHLPAATYALSCHALPGRTYTFSSVCYLRVPYNLLPAGLDSVLSHLACLVNRAGG